MIIYRKTFWGFPNLIKFYGSAFPRALPFSVASSALGFFLQLQWGDAETGLPSLIEHPYPYQAFAFVVGFLLVFRTQLSYGRYWEGRTQLQVLASKLTDVVVMCVLFDKYGQEKHPEKLRKEWDELEERARRNDRHEGSAREVLSPHEVFRDVLLHLASLLHGVALMTLREDYVVENIVVHNSRAPVPATNFVDAEVEGASLRDGKDTTFDIEAGYNAPIKEGPDAVPGMQGHINARAGGLGLSLWDRFCLRADAKRAREIHSMMPLPVIGQLSEVEVARLGFMQTKGFGEHSMSLNEALHGMYIGVEGEEGGGKVYTPAPTERVHTAHAWLQEYIVRRISAGGINVSSSIQSRIHNNLSQAMLGYEQCKKLNDARFPFPWAQSITFLVLMFVFSLPFIVAAYVSNAILATLITFLGSQTYTMLNEVARDVEDPFHYDPNELPLPQIQYRLNERLLAATRTERPKSTVEMENGRGLLQAPNHLQGYISEAMSPGSPPGQPLPGVAFIGGSPHSTQAGLPSYRSEEISRQVEEHQKFWRGRRRRGGQTESSGAYFQNPLNRPDQHMVPPFPEPGMPRPGPGRPPINLPPERPPPPPPEPSMSQPVLTHPSTRPQQPARPPGRPDGLPGPPSSQPPRPPGPSRRPPEISPSRPRDPGGEVIRRKGDSGQPGRPAPISIATPSKDGRSTSRRRGAGYTRATTRSSLRSGSQAAKNAPAQDVVYGQGHAWHPPAGLQEEDDSSTSDLDDSPGRRPRSNVPLMDHRKPKSDAGSQEGPTEEVTAVLPGQLHPEISRPGYPQQPRQPPRNRPGPGTAPMMTPGGARGPMGQPAQPRFPGQRVDPNRVDPNRPRDGDDRSRPLSASPGRGTRPSPPPAYGRPSSRDAVPAVRGQLRPSPSGGYADAAGPPYPRQPPGPQRQPPLEHPRAGVHGLGPLIADDGESDGSAGRGRGRGRSPLRSDPRAASASPLRPEAPGRMRAMGPGQGVPSYGVPGRPQSGPQSGPSQSPERGGMPRGAAQHPGARGYPIQPHSSLPADTDPRIMRGWPQFEGGGGVANIRKSLDTAHQTYANVMSQSLAARGRPTPPESQPQPGYTPQQLVSSSADELRRGPPQDLGAQGYALSDPIHGRQHGPGLRDPRQAMGAGRHLRQPPGVPGAPGGPGRGMPMRGSMGRPHPGAPGGPAYGEFDRPGGSQLSSISSAVVGSRQYNEPSTTAESDG